MVATVIFRFDIRFGASRKALVDYLLPEEEAEI
jgi:hypothetical protein